MNDVKAARFHGDMDIRQGDIFEIDGEYYIMARITHEEGEDTYVCIGLDDGNPWTEDQNTKQKAKDVLQLWGRNVEIKLINKE